MVRMTMLLRGLVATGSVIAMVGCTAKFGMMMDSDRFAYPNSNIEPLGRVNATVSSFNFFVCKKVDKEMYHEARYKALQQKGGDMILNAKFTTAVTVYPIVPPIIAPCLTELTVDGTAAKQTIGRQELK